MNHDRRELLRFYQRLARDLAAGQELPAAVRAFGAVCRDQGLRQVLDEVAAALDEGDSLAAAMKPHPRYFESCLLPLVEHAQAAGTLPETLADAEELARLDPPTEIARIPGAAIKIGSVFLALTLAAVLLLFILPQVADLDVVPALWGEGGSVYSSIYAAARTMFWALLAWRWAVVGLMAGLSLASLTAVGYGLGVCPGLRAAARLLPRTGVYWQRLENAQLCLLAGAHLRQGALLAQAIDACAAAAERPRFRSRLRRWAGQARADADLAEILEADMAADGLLLATVAHAPAAELPTRLTELSREYRDATASARLVFVGWWLAAPPMALIVLAGIVIAISLLGLQPFSDPMGGW